ncbi:MULTISPECIES: strawberry notch C-terminal domain-containing protein [unclassified Bradyrhizobium]
MATIEAVVPVVEFQEEAALDALHSVAQVNAFQARYEPESRIGKPIAMIPLNMASAMKVALARIVAEHGDIDRWIARRAKWSMAQLEQFVSPEQVDAVALMLSAIDRGDGAILADQTGLGKGRVLATVARICAIEGKRIVFLTEKANLFTDFWRDVRDTGSEEVLGAPFLLNGEATIVDQTSPDGDVLFSSMKKPDLAKVIKQAKLPRGTRLMMATYSQFNRKNSPKIELLRSVADGAVVIRDESHNAAGDSNTAAALASALAGAIVVHSSATYARDARNMQSYGSVLPPSLRNADLPALFRAGGTAFAEALSQALAEQGALIRREHDLSNIRIQVIDDLDRIDRNRAYVDALAPILSQMAVMGRRVTEIADEKTSENAKLLEELSASERKAAREKVYTMNFGAVLSALVRQVVTALLVDKCVEECVEILQGGEKPVVVIETTMEALMRDLAKGSMSEDDGATVAPPPVQDDGTAADDDAEPESAGAEAGARPPDYRDALRLAVQRLSELIVRKGTDDPFRVPVEEVDVVAMRDALLKAIGELPDLSLSPIDDLRERVEARGRALFEAGEIDHPWACDEISARSMRVANGVYETMPARDRNAVIAGFNGGRTDMVEVTRAGSTGLSLHASERVKDQRRRIMIELQIPSNVVERVQFWGRVNRRGQVCEPGFRTLSTGLPIQARNLAMQNRKVAQLSANVSASAENATSMDVPDIIDQTGNEICKRILTERPALADRMSIATRGIDEEQAAEELYYVNKLLQRLVLLPAAEQATLYDEVVELYEDAMRELAAQGKHPHHGRELHGSWKIETRELFDAGNPADGPVFGRPVWLATLKGVRDAAPLSSAAIETMIGQAQARLVAENGEANDLGYFGHQSELLRKRTDALLAEALPLGFRDVKNALSASRPNAVKIRNATLRDLRTLIARAQPGAFVTAPDEENMPATGRVVDVRQPDDDGVHLPGRWILRYVLPGDERPREISFATMLRERIFSIQPAPSPSDFRRLMSRYDAVPRGAVEQRRLMLEGNLVAAVRIAAEGHLGTAAAWTDVDGRRRRGVLIPKGRQAEIGSLPGSTFCKEAALEVLKRGGRLEAVPSRPSDGVVIRSEAGKGGQRLVVELPAEPKPVAERLRRSFEKAELRFDENYGMLSASVPFSAASKVLAAYMDSSRPLYFHGRFRALALASTASLRGQSTDAESEPAPAP